MKFSILRAICLFIQVAAPIQALAIAVPRGNDSLLYSELKPRASHWNSCKSRGTDLWSKLQSPGTSDKFKGQPSFAAHYTTTSAPLRKKFEQDMLEKALGQSGLNIKLAESRTAIDINGAYVNIFDTEKGVIVAVDNDHKGGRMGVPVEKFAAWSDLVYWQYEKLATQQGHQPSALNYVVRWGVVNEESQSVIEEAYRRAGKTKKDYYNEWAMWTPSGTKDEFLALLGTPNGRGAGYIAIDFPVSLGKTVKSIRTKNYIDFLWVMVIEFQSRL